MRFDEAVQRAREVNCRHALAVTLTITGDRVPPPSIDAVVMCKEKVRRGIEPTTCNLLTCGVLRAGPVREEK